MSKLSWKSWGHLYRAKAERATSEKPKVESMDGTDTETKLGNMMGRLNGANHFRCGVDILSYVLDKISSFEL